VSVDASDVDATRAAWAWLVAEGAPIGATLSQVATGQGVSTLVGFKAP
jgi:hypothetical protein